VFNLAQIHDGPRARLPTGSPRERTMVDSKNDKHKKYARYAAHCLEMVPSAPDRDFRVIQREMAAEWLKLAETLEPMTT
jgi:hypothetical protein